MAVNNMPLGVIAASIALLLIAGYLGSRRWWNCHQCHVSPHNGTSLMPSENSMILIINYKIAKLQRGEFTRIAMRKEWPEKEKLIIESGRRNGFIVSVSKDARKKQYVCKRVY